ncbi:hypothetical protein F5B17DRAFT_394286 [Nemania serpens]|nr:hypothetical protein F5B17DRAFT_394286 [Nemania serpens]
MTCFGYESAKVYECAHGQTDSGSWYISFDRVSGYWPSRCSQRSIFTQYQLLHIIYTISLLYIVMARGFDSLVGYSIFLPSLLFFFIIPLYLVFFESLMLSLFRCISIFGFIDR